MDCQYSNVLHQRQDTLSRSSYPKNAVPIELFLITPVDRPYLPASMLP